MMQLVGGRFYYKLGGARVVLNGGLKAKERGKYPREVLGTVAGSLKLPSQPL